MKIDNRRGRLVAVLGLFLSVGCAHIQTTESEKMLSLGAALTKVTSAVDDEVRYGSPPTESSEEDLLLRATQHDLSLLSPFKNYSIRLRILDNTAFLLVCTKDGKAGLLEDAGCTGKMDLNLWPDKNSQCRFQLQPKEVCQGSKSE